MPNSRSEMFTKQPEIANEVSKRLETNLESRGFGEYERTKVVEWIKSGRPIVILNMADGMQTESDQKIINGVARTYQEIIQTLREVVIESGLDSKFIDRMIVYITLDSSHDGIKFLKRIRLPFGYRPDVQVSSSFLKLSIIPSLNPFAVHIAVPESPDGMFLSIGLKIQGIPFSTAVHTRFDNYATTALSNLLRLNSKLKTPRWFSQIAMSIHRLASKVMATNETMKQLLIGLGFPSHQVGIMSRGVSQEFLNLAKIEKPTKEGGLKFLYFGRLAEEKNLEQMVRDFMNTRTSPDTLTIIGSGSQSYIQKLKSIVEKLSQLENAPEVIFLDGIEDKKDLAKLVANHDIMVHPSLTDTFGRTLIEATAVGLPVLHYAVNGSGEVLKGEKSKIYGVQIPLGQNLFAQEVVDQALSFEPTELSGFIRGRYPPNLTAVDFIREIVPVQ